MCVGKPRINACVYAGDQAIKCVWCGGGDQGINTGMCVCGGGGGTKELRCVGVGGGGTK